MRTRNIEKKPATLEDVDRKLDSLSRHVESLDKSFQTLIGRVVPYDGEDLSKLVSRPMPLPETKISGSLENLVLKIQVADRHIEAIERDFAAVRSLLESMDGDSQLRDDMIEYLKKPGRR